MAGARTVEEILNRGGGERFEITMIGDEPYGNYNRIMLSHVLAGEAVVDDEDLMLNPMGWYTENGVKLYAGDRAVALDRFAKTVTCESGRDRRLRRAHHRHRQQHVLPQHGRVARARRAPGPRGVRIPEHRGHQRDAADGEARDDVSAVVIGGGLLGLEAAYGLRTQGLTSTSSTPPGT